MFCFTEKATLLPLSFSSEYSSEGDYVQLTCVATKGDLPITFSWFLDGNAVSASLGATTVNVGRQTSLLIIQSVSFQNAGMYTCAATNAAGTSNSSAELIVKGNSNIKEIDIY